MGRATRWRLVMSRTVRHNGLTLRLLPRREFLNFGEPSLQVLMSVKWQALRFVQMHGCSDGNISDSNLISS